MIITDNEANGPGHIGQGAGIAIIIGGTAQGGNPEVIIEHSQIIGNAVTSGSPTTSPGSTPSGGGGGISIINGGTGTLVDLPIGSVTIRDSVISGNRSISKGGGVYFWGGAHSVGHVADENVGILTIVRSSITENKTDGSGGGLILSSSTRDMPGGVAMHIDSSTISGNTAYGLGHTSPTQINYGGGGIHVGSLYAFVVTNTTISGNRALNGGGLLLDSQGFIDIWNSTIANNAAGTFDPTDPTRPEYQDPDVPELVKQPQLTAGGGISLDPGSGFNNIPLLLDHTILGNNIHFINEPQPNNNDNFTPDIGNRPFGPGVISDPPMNPITTNYSIIENVGGHVGLVLEIDGANNLFVDPQLGPLADNGGFVLPDGNTIRTHALLPGSPAIDAGSDEYGHGEPFRAGESFGEPFYDPPLHYLYDQRGAYWLRVYNHASDGNLPPYIDIGAFELQPEPVPPCPPGDYNNNGIVDAADYTVWRDNLGLFVTLPNDVTPGFVSMGDYDVWKANFGATCEQAGSGMGAFLPGDYNHDGVVDDDDRDLWYQDFGSTTNLDADGDGNGIVDLADLAIWQEMRGVTTLEVIAGDFNEDGIVDMDDYGLWTNQSEEDDWFANFGLTTARIFPLIINSNGGMSFEIPMQAPQVIGVRVGGSNSTHDDYDFDGVVGSGEQLRTVPLGGMDTIYVTFSEEVLVTQNALTLVGMQGHIPTLSVSGFTYDVGTQTAAWEFSGVLPHGQYLFTLSDSIFDLDRDALDGEFTNPWSLNESAGAASTFPSGDGTPGGEFRFRFTNLSADFDRTNTVTSADYYILDGNHGMTSAEQPDGDANGDGYVELTSESEDFELLADQYLSNFLNWPSIEPGMILVSTASDEDDSNYSLGDLSLREAIAIAASQPGRDTIVFVPTIDEISLSLGQIVLDSDVSIVGRGAEDIKIDAESSSRIFWINGGVEVEINGLTLTQGQVSGHGGGIYNGGDLTLRSAAVVDNYAIGTSGGGIYSHTGSSLTIMDSLVSDNIASNGGGIYTADGADIVIQRSAIENNYVPGAGGGAYFSTPGALMIESSTIAGNHSDRYFGGISVINPTGAVIKNTTISQNSAHFTGGSGLQVSRTSGVRDITLINVTIADNSISPMTGGGLHLSGSSLTVNLHNSIIANNTDSGGANNISGSVASGSSHNLIGFGGSGGLTNGTNGNIVLSSGQSAGLASLGDYGGPTRTHALLSTSPAIDAGSNSLAAAFGLLYDQRGDHRVVDWDEDLQAVSDIGAFELAADEYFSGA